jgi:hypothetical protein
MAQIYLRYYVLVGNECTIALPFSLTFSFKIYMNVVDEEKGRQDWIKVDKDVEKLRVPSYSGRAVFTKVVGYRQFEREWSRLF